MGWGYQLQLIVCPLPLQRAHHRLRVVPCLVGVVVVRIDLFTIKECQRVLMVGISPIPFC
jgi:hypothetical protein